MIVELWWSVTIMMLCSTWELRVVMCVNLPLWSFDDCPYAEIVWRWRTEWVCGCALWGSWWKWEWCTWWSINKLEGECCPLQLVGPDRAARKLPLEALSVGNDWRVGVISPLLLFIQSPRYSWCWPLHFSTTWRQAFPKHKEANSADRRCRGS